MAKEIIELTKETDAIYLHTPDGEYNLIWDERKRSVRVIFNGATDLTKCDGSVELLPQSGNAFCFRAGKR